MKKIITIAFILSWVFYIAIEIITFERYTNNIIIDKWIDPVQKVIRIYPFDANGNKKLAKYAFQTKLHYVIEINAGLIDVDSLTWFSHQSGDTLTGYFPKYVYGLEFIKK